MQLSIGKIVNTHGIRGELKVVPNTDFVEERYAIGNEVMIKFGRDTLTFEIDSVRAHKGCLLVTFKGYHNINDVEKYKGLDLLIEVDGSEDDDYYYYVKAVPKNVIAAPKKTVKKIVSQKKHTKTVKKIES